MTVQTEDFVFSDGNNNDAKKFDAEEFYKSVIESEALYDDSINVDEVGIPQYFDKEKFERGKKFYEKHAFSIYFSTVLGLVGSFSHPSAEILGMTTKNGRKNAEERYWSTSKHMASWYTYELEPDSNSFRSLRHVRRLHHGANKSTVKNGLGKITQLYLTGAQFAFFAFPIFRGEKVGVFNASKEDQEGFVHFWRIIGYFMGLEDRFNVCRDSLDETKAICEQMVNMVWINWARKPAPNFEERVDHMVSALKKLDPLINSNALVCLYHDIIAGKEERSDFYINLTFWEKISYWHLTIVMSLLRFSLVRNWLNNSIFKLQQKVHP